MDVVLKYRGRMIRESDLPIIRALIEENPTASRRELSRTLCATWNWVQPNGAFCDMLCPGMLLALERAGHVWRGPRRRGIWDHATGSLAGAVKRGGATFALLHTTPGIWSCPGSRFLV